SLGKFTGEMQQGSFSGQDVSHHLPGVGTLRRAQLRVLPTVDVEARAVFQKHASAKVAHVLQFFAGDVDQLPHDGLPLRLGEVSPGTVNGVFRFHAEEHSRHDYWPPCCFVAARNASLSLESVKLIASAPAASIPSPANRSWLRLPA